MTSNLGLIVRECVAMDNFITTNLIDSVECIKWIPLLLYRDPASYLGLSQDGVWVVKEKEGVRILDETWKFLRVLILLETPRQSLIKTLTEALGYYNVNIIVEEYFPFTEIVKMGFEQKSDYWIELALNWLFEFPRNTQNEFSSYLNETLHTNYVTQKNRQKIIKLITQLSQHEIGKQALM